MEEMISRLQACALFKGLSNDELLALFGKITYQVLAFEHGDVVISEGDTCDYLPIIVEGEVRGEMNDLNGKILKIEDIAAVKPLAIAFIFSKNNRFPVTLTANKTVKIIRIWRNDLLKMMQHHPVFLANFLEAISNKAGFLSGKLNFLSFKTIRGKLAHFLMKRYNHSGNPVPVTETQQQLADLFGVTRPALARVISELEKEGIVVFKKKMATIKQPEKLTGTS